MLRKPSCSGFVEVRKGSTESNPAQTAQTLHRFGDVRMSCEPRADHANCCLLRLCTCSERFECKVLLYSSSKRNESNHEQTTLTAACSGCAVVWRGSNESNSEQTALSAACSDVAQVRRSSNESNYKQTTLTAACSDCALV